MPTWPSIRAPLRDGWRGAAPDGVRRTPMEQGPPKARVESIAAGAPETFVFKLDDADAAALDAFWASDKASRFDFDHPVWGEVEAMFMGPPEWSERGRWRYATVRLEIFR